MFSVLAAILILGNVVIGGEKAGEDAKVDEDDTYLLDACVCTSLAFDLILLCSTSILLQLAY